jgi:RNA polymerase sigma-70 factor (sigma-E family)
MENAAAVEIEPATGSRFEQLYQRHFRDAVRLAYLLTGDKALAEDLAQDAFVRLSGRLMHLRDPAASEPYLRRTVVNLANGHFRRRKVEQRYLATQASRPDALPGGLDPHEKDVIWTTLMTLPPRQRTAIVLRYYEDLSEAQTADVMRCAAGTVKSLVSRGLDKLRVVIADE